MSNSTRPTSVVTPCSAPEAPQRKPQDFAYAFFAPRDEGAPYPPYSLIAAEEHLNKAGHVPPELKYFDEAFFGHIYRSWEHVDAAHTLAGLLYRALEQEGSKSLSLARALCLALAEARYGVEMIDESVRTAILKAFGQEVR